MRINLAKRKITPMKKILLSLLLTAGFTFVIGNAKADISYFNTPFTLDLNFGTLYFTTDGTSFFVSTSGTYGIDTNLQNVYSDLFFDGNFTLSPLALGTPINSTTSFSSSDSTVPLSGYYGFSLNLGGGNYDYGWLNLSGSDYTVLSEALNLTPNQSIQAGQTTAVPEPSSYALFVFGVLALVLVAKRRTS